MFCKTTSRMIIVLAALCFFILPGSAPADEAAVESSSSDETVAVVNGDKVTRGQVDRELRGYQQRMMRSGQSLNAENLAGMREQVVEGLIDRALLYQASVKEGITVSQEEVDERFDEIRGQFPSEDAFQSALGQMGVTDKAIREELHGGLAVQKLIDMRFEKTGEISKEEARLFYDSRPEAFAGPEQVRARHILIQVQPDDGEEARQDALKTLEEIRVQGEGGKDFGELAGEYSQCPSKNQGGDLGYFPRGKMAKPFEDAAFALKPGEVSEVVQTQFGYHLIKLEDRKAEGTIPFEEVQERLRMYLGSEAVKEAVRSYVKQLRHDAVIERSGSEG